MSDSFDNNKELENFDEWEKNTASVDSVSFDTEVGFGNSLDLPDFDDSLDFKDDDFSSIFEENNDIITEDVGNSEDTTLTSDELSNLTSDIDSFEIDEPIEQEVEFTDDLDLPDFETISQSLNEPLAEGDTVTIETSPSDEIEDFSFDTISDDIEDSIINPTEDEFAQPSEVKIDETISDDFSMDLDNFNTENANEETETSILDNDESFNIEENTNNEEIKAETFETETDISTESFDVTDETFDDEEISLDDFIDEFSDESVAAGNNGFEPGKGPDAANNTSEEISLDDFFDGEFTMDEPQQEETVMDEKPLEMDISFDPSADSIETEANSSISNNYIEENETDEEEYEEEQVENQVEETRTVSDDIDAEEIDLSDFGIDANAEETPVTQDVESEKIKEKIVDYDLKVQNEQTSSAPVVNEVKATEEQTPSVENVNNENSDVNATNNLKEVKENEVVIESSILQQIVQELSNLKAELNSLREEQKQNAIVAQPIVEENIETTMEETSEPVVETEATSDEGGFFSSDDGDDTIALSTDELSNIMNSANFTEDTPESDITNETEESNSNESEILEESENTITENNTDVTVEDSIIEENVAATEDTIQDYSENETAVEENEIVSESSDNTIVEAAAVATGIGITALASSILNESENNELVTEESVNETENTFNDIIEENTDITVCESESSDELNNDSVITSEENNIVEEEATIIEDSEPVINDEINLSQEEVFNNVENEATVVTEEPVFEKETSEINEDNEMVFEESEPVVVDNEEPVFEETTVEVEEEDSFASVDDDFSFDSVEDDFEKQFEESVEETAAETVENAASSEPTEEFPTSLINEPIVENTETDDSFEFDSVDIGNDETEITSEIEPTLIIEDEENISESNAIIDDSLNDITFENEENSEFNDLPDEISIPMESTESTEIDESIESTETNEAIINDENNDSIFEDVIQSEENKEETEETSFTDYTGDTVPTVSEIIGEEETELVPPESAVEVVTESANEESIIAESDSDELTSDAVDNFGNEEPEMEETSVVIEEEDSIEEPFETSPVFDDVFENENDTTDSTIVESENDNVSFDSIIDSVTETENLEPENIISETQAKTTTDEDLLMNEPEVVENESVFEETSVNIEEDLSTDIPEEAVDNISDFDSDETMIETNFIANNSVEEDVFETENNEIIEDDDFLTTEENNELTDSNIDYLTTEEPTTVIESETLTKNSDTDNASNEELKKDIKSVLLYMDQLLENLPEEKIIEFAKSDEFATYKKLFSELGLS